MVTFLQYPVGGGGNKRRANGAYCKKVGQGGLSGDTLLMGSLGVENCN
jgi:hypothetical protein